MDLPQPDSQLSPSALQVDRADTPPQRLKPTWWIALIIFIAIVTGTTLIGRSPSPEPSPSPTAAVQRTPQPRITWSENQVEVILSPSETTSRSFTFTSSVNLKNVVIETVPALTPFVNIQPTRFANVPAGQAQSVTVAFSIPANATLGTYDGTIHVRVAGQTLPQTVKIVLRAWRGLSLPTLGLKLRYPPDWNVQSGSEKTRIQNYIQESGEGGNGLEPGHIFISLFQVPLSSNLDYRERLLDREDGLLSGRTTIRGFRGTADISTLPGYDMYVVDGDRLIVVAGSYDGLSSSSVDSIRVVQTTLEID